MYPIPLYVYRMHFIAYWQHHWFKVRLTFSFHTDSDVVLAGHIWVDTFHFRSYFQLHLLLSGYFALFFLDYSALCGIPPPK